MLIYIRHSIDSSQTSHRNDPKLTHEGKKLAERVGKELVAKYGPPKKIFSSPFRRTMSTSKRMTEAEIEIDPELSRFFKDTEKRNPGISSTTSSHPIPIYETAEQFKERCERVRSKYRSFHDSPDVYWIVTHTTLYKKLAKIHGRVLDSHIPYMDYFVASDSRKNVQRRTFSQWR